MTTPASTGAPTTSQSCGWCRGEGALQDSDGKLGEDCPRCNGASVLPVSGQQEAPSDV